MHIVAETVHKNNYLCIFKHKKFQRKPDNEGTACIMTKNSKLNLKKLSQNKDNITRMKLRVSLIIHKNIDKS